MKVATVNTKGWHWVLTDAMHQVKTGEILWLMRVGCPCGDVHTSNSGRLITSHTRRNRQETEQSANEIAAPGKEFILSVGEQGKMLHEDRPAFGRDTRHVGVKRNRRYFMPAYSKQENKVQCKGPPPP